MRLLIENLSRLGIEWNTRTLGEVDFHDVCERFDIILHDSPMGTDGFYYRLLGRDFIAINSRLTGTRRLSVLFHELGHFLLHVPKSGPAASFHAVGRPTRQEREADLFALCAVLPMKLVKDRTMQELIDAGYPADIVKARLAILERYGA